MALRQLLDLYVCLRPVRWYPGVPSPVKNPRTSTFGIAPGANINYQTGHGIFEATSPKFGDAIIAHLNA